MVLTFFVDNGNNDKTSRQTIEKYKIENRFLTICSTEHSIVMVQSNATHNSKIIEK